MPINNKCQDNELEMSFPKKPGLLGERNGSKCGIRIYKTNLEQFGIPNRSRMLSNTTRSCQNDSVARLKKLPLAKDGII